MRTPHALGFATLTLGAIAVVVACSNDYNLETPATPDGGAAPATGDDAGAPPGNPTDAATSDASPTEAGPSFPSGPPAIGTSCAAATPTPKACEDFEGTVDESSLFHEQGGTASVVSPGSSSGKALAIATVDGDFRSDGGFVRTLGGKFSHIAYSFDLLVDANILDTTTVGAIVLQNITSDLSCILELNRTPTGFNLNEFCESSDGEGGDPLFGVDVALPATPTWWNFFVDADLNTKRARLAIRTDPSSAIHDATGTLDEAAPAASEQIVAGIYESTGNTPNSKDQIDNVVGYWE